MNARSASHSLTAFSASVWKTGWRSKADRLITLRSSLVAVCCSNAWMSSRLLVSSSVNRRTFSMAMAGLGKLVGLSLQVGEVECPRVQHATAGDHPAHDWQERDLRNGPVMRGEEEPVTIPPVDGGVVGLA